MFRHVALLYSGERAFLDATAAFIRDGVTAGEPTLVAVGEHKIELLEAELGADAAGVCFVDMAELGANPGRIISAWDDFLRDNGGGTGRVRGIGEPAWAGRSQAELAECHRHESLLNLAFADAAGFWLVCPYDVDALDPADIEHARLTHPYVIDGGVEQQSPHYGGGEMAAWFDGPLDEPPAGAYEVEFDMDSLGAVRAFVGEIARDTGIRGARRDDLMLAVNEVTTNSVRHGGGSGVLRVWAEHGVVACEVLDSGRIEEPLVGRLRPPRDKFTGFGLWLVNQLCDFVQIRLMGDGCAVRLHMHAG